MDKHCIFSLFKDRLWFKIALTSHLKSLLLDTKIINSDFMKILKKGDFQRKFRDPYPIHALVEELGKSVEFGYF